MPIKFKINPFTARLDMIDLSVTGLTGTWGTETLVTMNKGAVTLPGAGRYRIETEMMAATAELNIIFGLTDGQEVLLRANSDVRTVILKNGAGNLKLQSDFSLNSRWDAARLICDASGYVVETGGRSDNG